LVAGEGIIVKVVKGLFREAEEGVGKGAARDLENAVDKRVEITLAREERMPKREFRRKALALQKLGDEGKLIKTKSVRDREVTKRYRQDLINRIHAQYGQRNPEFSKRLINRIAGSGKMQPDHIHELQLGGPDTAQNLRFLDTFTNWHIGTQQIRQQIRTLPDGTPIKIRIIKW
jgi:hypothetical protein